MRITSLIIRGFRNLAHVEIDFEADWTVLIGENNIGKTNVLDALYAALRVNRTVKQGAFDLHDYHLSSSTAMAGDAGPIELTVRFTERSTGEWSDDLIAEFQDVRSLNVTEETNSITLRVTSTPPSDGHDEEYDWSFLNDVGEPRKQRRYISEVNALQRLRPLYQLGALRDADREFNRRSTYFSPFVSDPTFNDDLREELGAALAGINAKVLDAHGAFTTLRDNITEGAAVVSGASNVFIEAVPTRLSELLANTQVSMNSRGGAALPLDRHGSGSQSMAVLSLFKAYVTAKLSSRFDAESRAILTLEEPESHLYPSAIRMLWHLVSSLDAQLIITTHSGDLLSETPLRCIRRLSQSGDGAKVHRIDLSQFTRDEIRQIEYGIQGTRGEMLLANVWLIVEGRTEFVGLKRLARVLGIDLHAAGVRIVECQQLGGSKPFIKLADELGITWHCLCDGDAAGEANVKAATALLQGRSSADHITRYRVKNIEAFLCTVGFSEIYLQHIPNEKRSSIVAALGTDDYANQIGGAVIDSRKERAILEVCLAVEDDLTRSPELLRLLLGKCCRLARP